MSDISKLERGPDELSELSDEALVALDVMTRAHIEASQALLEHIGYELGSRAMTTSVEQLADHVPHLEVVADTETTDEPEVDPPATHSTSPTGPEPDVEAASEPTPPKRSEPTRLIELQLHEDPHIDIDQDHTARQNALVRRKYGEETRTVTILSDSVIQIGDRMLPIHKSKTRQAFKENRAKILGMLINHRGNELSPAKLREQVDIDSGMSVVLSTIAEYFVDDDGKSIINIRSIHPRLSHYSIEDDVVVLDRRRPSAPNAQPAQPQSVAGTEQTLDQAPVSEEPANEAAASELPPGMVRAGGLIVPKADLEKRKERILRIHNIQELNERTRQLAEQLSMTPSSLCIELDGRIYLNDDQLETGPFMTDLWNTLLIGYLEQPITLAQMRDKYGFATPHYDIQQLFIKLHQTLTRLKGRNMIAYNIDGRNSISLRPVLITDRRQ